MRFIGQFFSDGYFPEGGVLVETLERLFSSSSAIADEVEFYMVH